MKLTNLFKKKQKEPNLLKPIDKSFELLIIEDDADNLLHTAFGMTKERVIFFNEKIMQLCKGEDQSQFDLLTVMINLSKECKHQNELAFANLRLGRFIEAQANLSILSSILP